MQYDSDSYAQHYYQYRQHIQGESAFLESGKETGSHLQADGIDKQNQAELFQEMEQVFVQIHVEVSEYDADKENPCHPERYSFYFDFGKDNAERYGERQYQYGVSYSATPEVGVSFK